MHKCGCCRPSVHRSLQMSHQLTTNTPKFDFDALLNAIPAVNGALNNAINTLAARDDITVSVDPNGRWSVRIRNAPSPASDPVEITELPTAAPAEGGK